MTTDTPSNNSKTLAKPLASMPSEEERETAFRKACELLNRHGRDWHDLVAAVERADVIPDPVTDPHVAERQSHNAETAREVLRKYKTFLTEDRTAFLQGGIDRPSKHDPLTTYNAFTLIVSEAKAKAKAHRKAKRARQ